MIKSFVDKALEECWKRGTCAKIKADQRERILMRLSVMDAATSLDDLANVPGYQLHPLIGKDKGKYAISVNGAWRIVFRYVEGKFADVYLDQYH